MERIKTTTKSGKLKKNCGAFAVSMLTIKGITVTLHKYIIQYLTLMSGTKHTGNFCN